MNENYSKEFDDILKTIVIAQPQPWKIYPLELTLNPPSFWQTPNPNPHDGFEKYLDHLPTRLESRNYALGLFNNVNHYQMFIKILLK